jgi:hypothetical protein
MESVANLARGGRAVELTVEERRPRLFDQIPLRGGGL